MSILDPKWKYIPSHETNIRKRFDAERRRLAEQKEQLTGSPPVDLLRGELDIARALRPVKVRGGK